MDQEVTHQRTTKVTQATNGGAVEAMKTHVIKSIHKESHLMSCNYGPMGVTDSEEIDESRKALSNRSWAVLVPPAPPSSDSDTPWEQKKRETEMQRTINQFRIVTCLVANVLIFIEEIPAAQPDLTYATKLCNEWDRMLDEEFNLPCPSDRKKIKRTMLMHLYAIESAVVEMVFFAESSVQYKDMRLLGDGTLPPWQIDMLAEVIKSLQRTLDAEVILNVWAAGLSHSPATSAHVFHVKTALAQMHGADIDFCTLDQLVRTPSATDRAAAEKAAEAEKAAADATAATVQSETAPQFADEQSFSQQAGPSAQPEDEEMQEEQVELSPEEEAALQAAEEEAKKAAEEAKKEADRIKKTIELLQRESDVMRKKEGSYKHLGKTKITMPAADEQPPQQYLEPARGLNGQPVTSDMRVKRVLNREDGMTRKEANELAEKLARERQMRSMLSVRLSSTAANCDGAMDSINVQDEVDRLTDAVTDTVKNGVKMNWDKHRHEYRLAEQVGSALLPNLQMVLNSGVPEKLLTHALALQIQTPVKHFGCPENAMLGISASCKWEYMHQPQDAAWKGPQDYNFSWRRLKPTNKKKAADSADAAATAKPTESAATAKRIPPWKSVSRSIHEQSGDNGVFSLLQSRNTSREALRDAACQWGEGDGDDGYKVRVPVPNRLDDVRTRALINEQYSAVNPETPPSTVAPQPMFVEVQDQNNNSTYVHNTEYLAPKSVRTSGDGSKLDGNLYEKRLDLFNNRCALPSVVAPTRFTRRAPVKEDNEGGVFVNTWVMQEHASLVVEIGTALATFDGLAGCNVINSERNPGPPTWTNPRITGSECPIGEPKTEEERQQKKAWEKQQEVIKQMATKAYKASHPSGSSMEEEECTDNEEDDSSENPIQDSRVRRRMPAAPTPPPSRQREEARSRVEQPDEGEAMDIDEDAELNLAKSQGIQDMLNAAATSSENAQISSLLYTWDMSLVYFTLCAMRTLHDDCSGYRKQFCKALDTTIEQLNEERIKMVMPFPTRNDKTLPLSYPMPLKESRFVEFGTSNASRKASSGMEARYWQCVGAALRSGKMPDPEDETVNKMQRKAAGSSRTRNVEGNLFSRSTWVAFTVAAMRDRGMETSISEAQVLDQGMNLRLRLLNHYATSDDAALRAKAPRDLRRLSLNRMGKMTAAGLQTVKRAVMKNPSNQATEGVRLATASAVCGVATGKRKMTAEEREQTNANENVIKKATGGASLSVDAMSWED